MRWKNIIEKKLVELQVWNLEILSSGWLVYVWCLSRVEGEERGVQYRSNWQSLTGSKSLLQPTEYRRDRISPVLPAFLPHLVAILHWQEFSWDNQGRAVTFQVKILSPVKTRNGPTQLIDYSHNLTQSYDLFLFQTQTCPRTNQPTHPSLPLKSPPMTNLWRPMNTSDSCPLWDSLVLPTIIFVIFWKTQLRWMKLSNETGMPEVSRHKMTLNIK